MNSWHVQQSVDLAPYTTLEVGGQAQYMVSLARFDVLPELLAWAHKRQLPLSILGGGSNLVVCDAGVRGLVVRLVEPAAHAPEATLLGGPDKTGTSLHVSAAANVVWDDLVAATCRRGAYGLACLSGIPGLCGAAPVQNIGAYGQSLKDSLVAVDTLHLGTGAARRMEAAQLGLGYRTSFFKTAWQGRYLITRLYLRLELQTPFVPGYAPLAEALAQLPGPAGPDAVRRCVLQLRQAKSMVWVYNDANRRSVGSFFTNPIVETAHAQNLSARFAAMPSWPQGAYTKLSAAWLIEQAGFCKGFRCGRAGLSDKHTLALINCGEACAQEVLELGAAIQRSVLQQFGVGLWPEPSFWGFGPSHPLPAAAHQSAWAWGQPDSPC